MAEKYPSRFRNLREKLKSGERIFSGYTCEDGTPIYFCTNLKVFRKEDCPRALFGTVFPIRGKVYTGCLGADPCDWIAIKPAKRKGKIRKGAKK